MKLDSKYFDRIRVKPDEDRLARDRYPSCQWQECRNAGTHRAPMGRGRDGQYHLFCLDHVREYNKSYNYFSGMSDVDVGKYQESAVTGHRPTWSLGHNPWSHGHTGEGHEKNGDVNNRFKDTFGFFHDRNPDHSPPRARPVRNAERKALSTLGLDENATAKGIKVQYKVLVKRHHPDANGGGKQAEQKLREIIQAYDYLKRAGFC